MTCARCADRRQKAEQEQKSARATARQAAERGIVSRQLVDDVTEADLEALEARQAAELCTFGICHQGDKSPW